MLDVPQTGAKELNRLVEKTIIEKNSTPSPLLKFYYQMSQSMGVDFCSREMLALDQKVFKEYVTRLVHAQEYHIKVTKRAALRESNLFMQE